MKALESNSEKGCTSRQDMELARRKDWAIHVWVRPGELEKASAQVTPGTPSGNDPPDLEGGDGAQHGGRATTTEWEPPARHIREH